MGQGRRGLQLHLSALVYTRGLSDWELLDTQ
jgi:hypothetical protein